MTTALCSFTSLTDEQLLARVKTLANDERKATAMLIAALTELDARRLYLGQGYPSLFVYCTQALRLSEGAAYNRIRAARAAAKWPAILDLIADGSVTVTTIRLLSDVLTDANHQELLCAATHKSKREIEVLVATVKSQPIPAVSIRKMREPVLPSAPPAASSIVEAPARVMRAEAPRCDSSTSSKPAAESSTLAPLSADHYRITFTISRETRDRLRQVQDLMRHANPTGDPSFIFDRALTLLLEQLEKVKLGKNRPRWPTRHTTASRHVPSAVKREVWARDKGQCAFVGTAGRCGETGFLEFHHVMPYADGGEATTANIQLRCRAHNAYEADQWFGSLVPPERNDGSGNWFRNG